MSEQVQVKDEDIKFFGDIDRSKDGKRITSEYPAYTFPQQIENAKEELAQKSRAFTLSHSRLRTQKRNWHRNQEHCKLVLLTVTVKVNTDFL